MADGGRRMTCEDGTEMQVVMSTHVATSGRRGSGVGSRTGPGRDELGVKADELSVNVVRVS